MYRVLRRHQPKSVVLAIAYWLILSAITLAAILVGYYFLDKVVPQGGY